MKNPTRLKKASRWFQYFLLGLVAYLALMLLIFRTPKTSYWIDDPTYGETPYFHFKAGEDVWTQAQPTNTPLSATGSYRLAIVELDEYGDFFQSQKDRSRPEDYQLNCAKQMLLDAYKVEEKPVLLFLFVHGWRHDASPKDENLIGFKQLLGYVAKSDWGTNKFAVCGVYVGWRGASIRTWGPLTAPVEYLSFWSRKSVAEKIASTPASSALFGLTDVARTATPDPKEKPSSIVLAGHSLGAGILMNSVSQALAYEYARASSLAQAAGDPTPKLHSPANLILLLNPAFESVYLRQLRISVQPKDWTGYPWLVSLTSETDMATKYVFPLAQYFRFSSDARQQPYREMDWSTYQPDDAAALTNPLADISQKIYARNTPGHNAYMRDYRLVIKPNDTNQLAQLKDNNAGTNDIITYGFRYGKAWQYFLLKGAHNESSFGYFNPVRPTTNVHPLFCVATVDPLVMNGHSLPFEDSSRRENFMATIMTLLSDSRVQHPEEKSDTVPLKVTQSLPLKLSSK